jgi:putative transposase
MDSHRRRLPHLYEVGRTVFLTWRIHDSLPSNRAFPTDALSSGKAFAAMDRLLDEAAVGPRYLAEPAVAEAIVHAVHFNANELRHYRLHAFVIMPNHVHILATPLVPLPIMMKSLKGITAKRANAILRLTGRRFWQDESYDHLVRNDQELIKIMNYIEQNPVKAGLVKEATEYRWSSAGW